MKLSSKVLAITPSITLQITAMAKEMRAAGKDVIGFGAGEPDLDTPEYIKEAAKKAIDDGFTKYTDASGILELRQAVCGRLKRKYGLDYKPSQIVISNGAKHSLSNTYHAILNTGDEAIIISPYWVSYPELVKMAGGVPVFVRAHSANNFEPEEQDIRAAITDKTAVITVNSPSNPCGCVYSRKTLEMIAGIAKEHDLYVISDEIYDELAYTGSTHISFPTLSKDAYSRTVLINGLSKAYAMTGWRMGYAACDERLAKMMGSYQSHATSNACSVTQKASVAAMNGPQDDLGKMVREFEVRRDMMYEKINKMKNVSCLKPQGAFYVMMNIKKIKGKQIAGHKIESSVDFASVLLNESLVAVVPGSAFGADDFVRLSYATSRECIEKGLARIAEFLERVE